MLLLRKQYLRSPSPHRTHIYLQSARNHLSNQRKRKSFEEEMNEVADDLKGEMEEVTADQLAKYAHRVATDDTVWATRPQ